MSASTTTKTAVRSRHGTPIKRRQRITMRANPNERSSSAVATRQASIDAQSTVGSLAAPKKNGKGTMKRTKSIVDSSPPDPTPEIIVTAIPSARSSPAPRSNGRRAIRHTVPTPVPPASDQETRGAIGPPNPRGGTRLASSKPGRKIRPGSESTYPTSPAGSFDELRLVAETFADIQKLRVGIGNRASRAPADVQFLELTMQHLTVSEDMLSLTMRRTLRRAAPKIAAWAKATVGIGEHTVARLVGTIGDPAIARPMHWLKGPAPEGHVCGATCGKNGNGEAKHLISDESYARSLAQLWAYCGHGDPTRRKRKGMDQSDAFGCGNPRAKMLIHLMAECAMKQRESRYRPVYDSARLQYAGREGWTLGHQHNAALRKVGKEILRDLWLVARSAVPLSSREPKETRAADACLGG